MGNMRFHKITPAQQSLLGLWQQKCAGRMAPRAADLDRKEILPAWWPFLVLVEVEAAESEPRRFRIRHAGCHCRRLYGLDSNAEYAEDSGFLARQNFWRNHYNLVTERASPHFGRMPVNWTGAGMTALYWLCMPLSEDGGRVTGLFCYEAWMLEPADDPDHPRNIGEDEYRALTG